MSTVTVDSKYRVVLDKKVRRVAAIKKGERLVAVPFKGGVILMSSNGRSFVDSLHGFKFKEAKHEADRYLLGESKNAPT